jgi:HTH-type transcriptional regulator, sugar sensing transcriptional regulator
VLDFLLEKGENKARDIAKATPHPRGVVYKALEDLLDLKLVEKIENPREIARFKAVHPRKLEEILEEKESELAQSKKLFEGILPQMISSYNLTLNKPGVRFYEGAEGMQKILDDTLTSKTDVLLFLNKEALLQEEKFKEINEEHKKKRERSGIKKKIIRVGQKPENTFLENNAGQYGQLTEIKYIEKELPAFKASVQIYDNKISYQIIDGKNIVSILIDDKNIYEMQKALFEIAWDIAK